MLNYIWLALIVIGVLVAVGNDWNDLQTDRYHNGEAYDAVVGLAEPSGARLVPGTPIPVNVRVLKIGNATAGDTAGGKFYYQNGTLTPSTDSSGLLEVAIDANSPPVWRVKADGLKKTSLAGTVRWNQAEPGVFVARFTPDDVKFLHLNAVTNDGFIRYAKTAVELAIGLIGIMALWLGVMKIAEESGLVAKVAAAVRPVTRRLFPDVPPDHPAMGAMVMNISANMLGLSNAATPLGLKAMEELNKLSTKAGTATDAMCTFLVINTSSVQLIPATVIALRSAAGSTNPTEILGPVIVATTVNTVVGVVTVRLLSKLPYFRRQLSGAEARP
jgi:spore maturation protein A